MREALHLARLCQASYDDADPRFRNAGGVRYGIIEGDLIIRGTANWRNVLLDLMVVPWRGVGGSLVHLGVSRAATKVWHALSPADKAAVRRVSGHSLGGGAAVDIARALRVPVDTFGCLRLDFRAAESIQVEHRRFVCDDDPVTMIPRIFYNHTVPPIILADRDGGIDVKDHGIKVYIRRLEAQTR